MVYRICIEKHSWNKTVSELWRDKELYYLKKQGLLFTELRTTSIKVFIS